MLSPVKIWRPADDAEYLDTLHSLSLMNGRLAVSQTGKIKEINFITFIFEKIKAFFTHVDLTRQDLLSYHLVKFLQQGYEQGLLKDQEEKVKRIIHNNHLLKGDSEIVLPDLFEQFKTPLETKIDRLKERLLLCKKRETNQEKYSFHCMFKKITEKYEWNLLTKNEFGDLGSLFREWRKDWEPRVQQIEDLLKKIEYTEDYSHELEEYFEQLLYRWEVFFKNFNKTISDRKLKIFFTFNGLRRQIFLERGLVDFAKQTHHIDAHIESSLKKNSEHDTLLHLACAQKDLPLIKWLLKKGANLSVKDSLGFSPLNIAIVNKNVEIARLLIEKGANIHELDVFGTSLLMNAVRFENLEIAKLLKEKGIKFNQFNDFDANPIGFAIAYFRSREMISFLLENGVKLNSKFIGNLTYEQAIFFAKIPIEDFYEFRKETLELWQRKFLTNIWTIPESASSFLGEEVSLEGGIGRSGGLKETIFQFNQFQEQFFKDLPSLEFVKKILNKHGVLSYSDPKECLARFKAGDPLLFDSGYTGHVITILYYGSYLLILNRGGVGKDHAIFVQKIDRQKAYLTEKYFEKLLRGQVYTSQAKRIFYEILPKLSGAIAGEEKDPIIHCLHQLLINNQKMGNCWFVSPKLLPLAIMAISELIKHQENCPAPRSFWDSFFYGRQQKRIVNQAYYHLYKPFTNFMRLNGLKTYLKNTVEEKETFKRDSIEPDHELIQKIMRKYYGKYKGAFSYFKELEKEIGELYLKYLDLFEKKPVSIIIPTALRVLRQFKPKIHFRKHWERRVAWTPFISLKIGFIRRSD